MKFAELLAKYNSQAPRYTSYPTVPYWDKAPSEAEWLESIRVSLSDSGAAIYIHMPFCEKLCTFCACNTFATKNYDKAREYVDFIHKEFLIYKEKIGFDKLKVAEIHIGGGTPTYLSPQDLDLLLSGLYKHFEFIEKPSLSFEAHPSVTTKEHLQKLYDFGFERVSFGVQDYDTKVQKIINRINTPELVSNITKIAREIGYNSINYDLIYGLPLQTEDSIKYTIGKVIEDMPERIAFYSYAFVPWVKAGHRKFTQYDLPNGENKRRLYEIGREMLIEAGYCEIGMDHFALKKDGLYTAMRDGKLFRNFMGYTPHPAFPTIGLGASSISDSFGYFIQNEKILKRYYENVNHGNIPIMRGHVLDEEDLVLRRHILNLMTKMQTDLSDGDVDFLKDVVDRFAGFIEDGLLKIDDNLVVITDKGKPFIRNICMFFDARMQRNLPKTEKFSNSN